MQFWGMLCLLLMGQDAGCSGFCIYTVVSVAGSLFVFDKIGTRAIDRKDFTISTTHVLH